MLQLVLMGPLDLAVIAMGMNSLLFIHAKYSLKQVSVEIALVWGEGKWVPWARKYWPCEGFSLLCAKTSFSKVSTWDYVGRILPGLRCELSHRHSTWF